MVSRSRTSVPTALKMLPAPAQQRTPSLAAPHQQPAASPCCRYASRWRSGRQSDLARPLRHRYETIGVIGIGELAHLGLADDIRAGMGCPICNSANFILNQSAVCAFRSAPRSFQGHLRRQKSERKGLLINRFQDGADLPVSGPHPPYPTTTRPAAPHRARPAPPPLPCS